MTAKKPPRTELPAAAKALRDAQNQPMLGVDGKPIAPLAPRRVQDGDYVHRSDEYKMAVAETFTLSPSLSAREYSQLGPHIA